MSTRLKYMLIVLALLVLLAGTAVLLLSRVDMKLRFEALASEVTGLQVAVHGGASIGLFPTPHVALQAVTLKNMESPIASVGEADIGVEWWPLLLRREVRIKRLVLRNLSVEVERDRNGYFNFENPTPAKRMVPAMSLGRLALSKASFRYTNRQADNEVAATDCSVDSNHVQLVHGYSADILAHLSLTAQLVCVEARNDRFVVGDVNAAVTGERGSFKLAPLTMLIMGGKGSGTIDAEFVGERPAYRVHFAVTQLYADELFKFLASGKVGEGMLDFTADLSMRGRAAAELTRTAQGTALLRGENLAMESGERRRTRTGHGNGNESKSPCHAGRT